jgi:hypothetical protein
VVDRTRKSSRTQEIRRISRLGQYQISRQRWGAGSSLHFTLRDPQRPERRWTGGVFDVTGTRFFVSIQHNVTGHGVISADHRLALISRVL